MKDIITDQFKSKNYQSVKYLISKGVRLCPYRDYQLFLDMFALEDLDVMKNYIDITSEIVHLETL